MAGRARPVERGTGGALDPAARHPGDGGPGRPGGADRSDLFRCPQAGGIRASGRLLPHRPGRDRSESEARQIVLEGLQAIAEAARGAGVRLGLEPIRASSRERTTIVSTVGEAIELLDEAGLDDVGILLDTYNVGDTPTVLEDVARFADRIVGVQVADAPADEPERGDRVLPGEGSTPTREIVHALVAAGWDGFVDVEIFSTPARFWGLPVDEAARRAYAAARSLLQS